MSKTGGLYMDELAKRDVVIHELASALDFYAWAWRTETKELRGDPNYNDGRELVLYKSQVYPNHDLMADCGNKARAVLAKLE